jgi:hypothetical protein
MTIRVLVSLAVVATLAAPLAAHAQGTLRGAEEGAAAGGNAAGPVGAIVGGAIGAATGTVGGILGVEDRPRFREYGVRERHPSYSYRGDVRASVVLPEDGILRSAVTVSRTCRISLYRRQRSALLVEVRTRRIVDVY